MSDAEIADTFIGNPSAHEAAGRLVALANQHGAVNNVSVIVLLVLGDSLEPGGRSRPSLGYSGRAHHRAESSPRTGALTSTLKCRLDHLFQRTTLSAKSYRKRRRGAQREREGRHRPISTARYL